MSQKTYLVAYDGSKCADECLNYLAEFARQGSKVILFGAYEPGQYRIARTVGRRSDDCVCSISVLCAHRMRL